MHIFSVSVLIAIYNPQWDKLKATLNSVVRQKDISFQIVICDDYSIEDYSEKLSSFMTEKGFTKYKYVRAVENGGTVKNLINGLPYCEGDYIKVLGQGDLLFDSEVLKNMYRYAVNNGLQLTGGLFQCFREENGAPTLYTMNRMPQILNCSNSRDRFYWYVVCMDIVNAVTLLYRKDCLFEYLSMMDGRIKYCEDHASRLMLADDVKMDVYKAPVAYYEISSGISTARKSEFKTQLSQDNVEFYNMLIDRCADDKHLVRVFKNRIRVIEHYSKRNVLRCLFSDFGILRYWFHCKFFPIKTSTEWQNDFLQQCYSD